MKKVALMCDSSADITEEEAKALDIHVLRMPITIDGKEYIDSKTISDNDIIEALRAEKQVKTAQAGYWRYGEYVDRFIKRL